MDGVSVIVPTWNRSGLLPLTLTSILRQREVDLHVIVVDDGSTEDVPAVVSRAEDRRVRVLRHETPRGVSTARNSGLAAATTRWVAFCDDDDLWSPEKLRRQVRAADAAGAQWAYTGCVYVNPDLVVQSGSPPLGPEAMRAALRRYNAMPAGASNVTARTELLRRLGGFDASLTHLPDWDLWLRLAGSGAPGCVPDPLVGYRLHGGNASFRTAEMLAEVDGIERRHGIVADRSRFHRHLARLCLRVGRQGEAVGHLARALASPDGWNPGDVLADARLLRERASEGIRRRLGRPRSPEAEARRWQAARRRDPNAAWKAGAQDWIDELARSVAGR